MSKKKWTLKSAGRIILLAVISLMIGIKLYGWNARTLAGNAMPMPFGWGVSVVLTGSMEPTLSANDLVIVRERDSYELGDIVVYQDGKSLVIHRIIEIDGETVTTKGDDNDSEDLPIPLTAIKGEAVGHIPVVGAVARLLKTPAATVVLLIAAILLFELPYLQKRKKAEEEKEKIKEEIRRLKDE